MNYGKIRIITQKEITEIWTTRLILWSTVIVVLLFGLGMPAFMLVFAVDPLVYQVMMYAAVGPMNMLIGFLLPTYVAADSFVGEKERRTLERLLAIPLDDEEILVGKMLTCILPTTAIAWLCCTISAAITWIGGAVLLNIPDQALLLSILFPSLIYFIAELIITFLGTVAATSIMVLVSTRAHNLREATQFGSLALTPLILIVFSQMAGAIPLEGADTVPSLLFELYAVVLIVVFGIVAVIGWFVARGIFNREKLIAKL